VDDQNVLSLGQTIGHYQILSRLGTGGMGEVYLALDTKLDRKVALKVLPADVASHQDRMRRFIQEAKAASALNHPNIITIHEIDQADSIHFIATEYVYGKTLRQRMREAPMKVVEVLDVAIQVARALSAAHAAGIVHRDIKPENIMIRRDAIVKVLDFGLAKLSERASPDSVDAEAPTRAVVRTEPGVVMGTAVYMSPEQARGVRVDARTDIFSLGVLIYEMLAGRLPFEGSNTNEIIASILSDRQPLPLTRYARQVPSELERIVEKALRKDREQRYQTVKDMVLDLKSLKQRQQVESELERSRPPGIGAGQAAVTGTSSTASGQAAQTSTITESFANRIKAKRRTLTIVLPVLMVAAASLIYLFYFARPGRAIDSIAVLPLSNTANDPNTEYLSDGMTESIISNLSRLPQLKVMARSTVFHFKGKEIDPRDVGRQLGVRAVMSGRLLQQGDHLIVRAELVNVADGAQLWGAEYDRKLSDVLALQQEISREISENLRLKLTGEEKKRLAGRDTNNAEAYQLYLLGRFHWSKFTEEGIRKSIDSFNQALAKDPNYALAYHGLSDAYAVLGQIGFRPNDVLPKSLVYADKALAADPTLPEAHLSRGAYELWYGWNWTMAEQELKRAMELNTNLTDPHDLYGQFLSGMGRFDEAIAENKRSLEGDPLSHLRNSHLAGVYYWARQYDLAIGQSRKGMELDTNFFEAPLIIGQAYTQQGKYPEAIAELTKTRDLPGGFVPATSELGYIYAVSGQRAKAQELLSELHERAKREFIDPYYVAIIYLGLGEQEQTFAWLNRAHEERSYWLLWLRVEPRFDGLRSDPRYQDLVRRMNFPS
jgi:serine/threonine-protein kinase